jgi:hypothetical protein
VDGIVGPQTWNDLVNGYLAARDMQTATPGVFSAWETSDLLGVNELYGGRYWSYVQLGL